jgi:hypothetical protein
VLDLVLVTEEVHALGDPVLGPVHVDAAEGLSPPKTALVTELS